jgi:hypothetical protein
MPHHNLGPYEMLNWRNSVTFDRMTRNLKCILTEQGFFSPHLRSDQTGNKTPVKRKVLEVTGLGVEYISPSFSEFKMTELLPLFQRISSLCRKC